MARWCTPTKAAIGFPDIPGVPLKDNFENPLIDYDWGANFNYNDVSGVASERAAADQAGDSRCSCPK